MSDHDYRHRLLSDPHSALREIGVNVPKGVSVRVVENAPNSIHLTLPQRPSRSLLDDETLNRMASGGFDTVQWNTIGRMMSEFGLPGPWRR